MICSASDKSNSIILYSLRVRATDFNRKCKLIIKLMDSQYIEKEIDAIRAFLVCIRKIFELFKSLPVAGLKTN